MLRQGTVFYENNSGREYFKQALVDFDRQHYTVHLSSDQFVVVTCGGTQAVLLTMLSVLSPRDDMINVTPNWPNFTEAARIAGAVVHDVHCDLSRNEVCSSSILIVCTRFSLPPACHV